MHILIAPDKFKGSLTGRVAAQAIRDGFAKVFPDAAYILLPLADGGEGILDAFRDASDDVKPAGTTVSDALGRDVEASWLLMADGTAIIESSQANGLWRIAENERDVQRSSTFGVGQLLLAAASAGASRIIVGIGGSATNDAGIGLASALGCRFLDESGNNLDAIPLNFPRITSIDSSGLRKLPPIRVACDVSNPLLGPRGATRVYGSQKGLPPEAMESAEAGLSRFAEICGAHFGTRFQETPGAGAAGGLGYGLMTFCSASLESGFDCIAGALGAEKLIALAGLVITAEGSLDSQTLEGKTPHGVSKLARKHGVPVYALAGRLADEELLHGHFDGIASIMNSPMTLEQAIESAPQLLELAATRLAHTLRNSKS
ncbi:glycerate kinase [Akkermansiaceae bacterium]|nr:glycerate kinase [Akkermansiaceae bacterium]